VGYCPAIFPSPDHPPPKIGSQHSQSLPARENLALWKAEEQQWNELFGTTLNEEREKAGLAPVENVLRYVLTDRPWLAADPAIAPMPSASGLQIVTSGAWFLPDQSSLPDPLEEFLASGPPPVYFGLGSMRATGSAARIMIEAARETGCRVILSQGWANLMAIDAGEDCLVIGDTNHEKLFPRVAAVVHHGGAGTTTAATRAGRSQVVLPQIYDQYYWAHRIQELGVGVSGPPREQLNMETLVAALRETLRPETATRAQSLAGKIEKDGARMAAERLLDEFG
jgi:vancomycin aglycone glucosyltransferase